MVYRLIPNQLNEGIYHPFQNSFLLINLLIKGEGCRLVRFVLITGKNLFEKLQNIFLYLTLVNDIYFC